MTFQLVLFPGHLSEGYSNQFYVRNDGTGHILNRPMPLVSHPQLELGLARPNSAVGPLQSVEPESILHIMYTTVDE